MRVLFFSNHAPALPGQEECHQGLGLGGFKPPGIVFVRHFDRRVKSYCTGNRRFRPAVEMTKPAKPSRIF
jgi:hypothetical protein